MEYVHCHRRTLCDRIVENFAYLQAGGRKHGI